MEKIKTNVKIKGKSQGVFVILYALDGKPWINYQSKPERQNLTIPTCVMVNRADGCLGFVGGKVDKGETLKQALKREVKEEIGYEINELLEPVVAHDVGPFTTHVFALKLGYEDLRQIQKNVQTAEHFGSEITGLFLPHLFDYENQFGKGGGLIHLLKSSLALSVREEFMHFLLNKKIFTKKDLSIICDKCGYSLKALLV